jgi:anti-sigma B factor antagonist
MLNIEIDNSRDFTVAKVSGELGVANVERFAETLHEHAVGERAALAVDLSALQFIDSSGLSGLIQVTTRARLSRGRVILVAPTPLVSGVLSVTRLDSWFEVCDSLEEAGRRFSQG